MLKYVVTGFMAVALVAAVPAPEQPNVDCFSKDSDMLSCLAVKAISTINRVSRSPKLEIIEGVSFVRDSPVERSSRALETESAMIADLPKDPIDKTMTLVGKFVDSGVNFLKSHSLNVNPEGVARAGLDVHDLFGDDFLKSPKVSKVFLKWLGNKTIIPTALTIITIFVLKALFLSKIGLIVGGVLLFRYLANNAYFASWFNRPSLLSSYTYTGTYDNTYNANNNAWSTATATASAQPYYNRAYAYDRLDAGKVTYTNTQPEVHNTNEAH